MTSIIVKINYAEWLVPVKVLDQRKAFGRMDFLVEPIYGSGEQTWVARRSILDPPKKGPPKLGAQS